MFYSRFINSDFGESTLYAGSFGTKIKKAFLIIFTFVKMSKKIFKNYRVQFQHTDNNSTATEMVPCGSVSYKLPEEFAGNSKFREEYLCPQELGQFNFTGLLNNIVMLDS